MEERLFALRGAARKYQVGVEELPQLRSDIESKVISLEQGGQQEKQLLAQCESTRKTYEAAAEALHALRQKAAQKMVREVTKELEPLKMGSTRFEIAVEKLEPTQWNSGGFSRISFLVSTNKGTNMGALHKIASGGELSRFMLALKVVCAGIKSTPCLIFDEIDTGTGGAVADAIGKRLAKLAAKHQVFVVTHLPQVAAAASQHFRVSKQVRKGNTFTEVIALDSASRAEEMARMLAGEEVTPEARKAALKLMKAAHG